MKVYSTFFKIIKKNIGTIIMYIAIFVLVSLLSASFGSTPSVTSFEASKTKMAVIDRDNTTTSQGIYDYLSNTQQLIDLEDDIEVFQDELYYRNVSLIIIIPENMEANLIAGKEIQIESIEEPNSQNGIYIELQLEQYLSILKNYLSLGVNPTEALAKTSELMNQQTTVSVQTSETTASSTPNYHNYFALMPYALTGIMVSILGMVMLAFNQEDLRRRTICSSFSLKKRNLSLVLGCLTLAFAILLTLLILPLLIYGTDMLSSSVYIFYVLNALAMTIFSVSLGFLIGLVSKTVDHVGAYGTTFSLGLNFLGGVFVPLSFMPESVINVSKFFPTYWYSMTSAILAENSKLTGENLHDVIYNILIQVGFAVVIMGVALVFSRRKNQSV